MQFIIISRNNSKVSLFSYKEKALYLYFRNMNCNES